MRILQTVYKKEEKKEVCKWCTRTGHLNCYGNFTMGDQVWKVCNLCLLVLEEARDTPSRPTESYPQQLLRMFLYKMGITHQEPAVIGYGGEGSQSASSDRLPIGNDLSAGRGRTLELMAWT